MAGIIEVARALRAPLRDKSIITAFASAQIDDASPTTILRFIEQAFDHQKKVDEESVDSQVFSGKVVEVKRIKRESNGFVLGHKAVIVLESNGSDGKTQEEEISTGWVEFKGADHPDEISDERNVWEVALSRSIEEDAKELIGRSAFVRKVVMQAESGGNKKVRYVADIERDHREDSGGSKKSSSGGGRSSGRKSDSGSDEVTERSIKALCKELDIEYGDEFGDLTKVERWDGKVEEVAELAADAVGVPDGSEFDDFVDNFVAARGKPIERAIIATDKWLG